MKPTWRYCFCLFHSNDPKPKRIIQIASNRAKTRPRQSQICVKYRGIIICIERNRDVNTSDLKILYKKVQIWLIFKMLSSISPNFHGVTHCQSNAMTFVLTQYSFCNSIRHCLFTACSPAGGILRWWAQTDRHTDRKIDGLIDRQTGRVT